jgi:hypothetical protein
MFGVQISLEEATAEYQQGLFDLREQVDGVKKSVGDWRGALLTADGQVNTSTEAGIDLLKNLSEQGDAYRTLAQTAFDTALRQGQSQEQATEAARRAITERREQFQAELRDMGFNEGQAKRLADTYLGMPQDIRTLISLHGVTSVEDQIRALTKPRFINVRVQYSGALQPVDSKGRPVGMPFLNDGGLVPGAGPDRDSVPAVLTPGEFVVKRSAAQRNLPLLEAINRSAGGDVQMAAMGMAALSPSADGGWPAGSAGGGTAAAPAQRIVIEFRSSGTPEDDYLLSRVQNAIRVRGGDVQLVLGGRG